MKLVFADSFSFFALLNRADKAHGPAVAFGRATFTSAVRSQVQLVTTDWVLPELADGLASSKSRQKFMLIHQELQASRDVQVLSFSSKLFEAGIDLYARRCDKDWSLTDCISFVVMREYGIKEAPTGDHHFVQAGFTALLNS